MDDPGSPKLIKKFSQILKGKNDAVTEEEIRSMVDAGEETGAIENDQREMINNIFEFDDSTASDLMTHRTDITAADKNDGIATLRDLAIEQGYSRIPVFDEDIDNIVGIVYIKDILKYVDKKAPKTLCVGDIMRKAMYVPETVKCSALFEKMRDTHTQMAIVVDEYGGTAGLITMEDLLEAIVGSIQDEYDDEEDEITQIGENVFTVDGTTDISEIEDLLRVKMPDGDFDTISGFMISLLGYIPEEGSVSEADYANLHLTAFDVEDRRIGKIKIERGTLSQRLAEAASLQAEMPII